MPAEACQAIKQGAKYICHVCATAWPMGAEPRPPCKFAERTPHRLSDVEANLYFKLRGRTIDREGRSEAGDVPIRVLYKTVAKRWPPPDMSSRVQQQTIGPYLARLNVKLAPQKLKVVPGIARASYRLVQIHD